MSDRLLSYRPGFLAAALFLILPVLGLWLRPLIPNGETRYITVAWNVWLTNDHVLLRLDGAPYFSKPPFLFVAIEEAWDLFGPLESVARLVPPVFTAGTFILIAMMARLLWPERRELASYAPFILLSFIAFATYGQQLMFDGTLALWALVALVGLVAAAQGRTFAGFLAFAAGICFGILTKGPVLLVFVLPAALFHPLWRVPATSGLSLGRWYAGVAMAFLAGILPPLIWAFAAVNAAGGGYGFETLWHQVVDRLFPATASHQHAWWYYLMYLPALAFPWIFWPGAWSASRWCEVKGEWQVRFLLVVAMTALLILTASSGKRFLYLLPIYPALALLVARLLAAGEPSARLRTFAWFPLLIAALGACAMAIGYGQESVPELFREGMAPWFGPVLLLFAVCYLLTARIGIRYYAQALALLTVTLMLAGEVAAWRILQLYDPSRLLSAIPDVASVPLAMHPRHRGQFGYAGRRIRPIDPVPSEHEIRDWAEKNPDGYLIAPMKAVRKMSKTAPLQIIPYGFQSYGIWKAGRF